MVLTSKMTRGNWVRRFIGAALAVVVSVGAAADGAALPAGYTALAYIESTGKQYIDTLYQPTTTTRIDAHFNSMTETATWSEFFGVMANDSSANGIVLRYYSGTGKINGLFCNATYGEAVTAGAMAETDVTVTLESGKMTVNGVEQAITTVNSPCTGTLTIFGAKNNAAVRLDRLQAMRLYSFVISERSAEMRAYLPCRNPAGVAGLYETHEGRFFPSEGAMPFLGPDGAAYTWRDGAEGVWSDPTMWVEAAVPHDGDALSFGGSGTASNDLVRTWISSLAKTGSGTVTLTGLSSDLVIGALTHENGTLALRWANDVPSTNVIAATGNMLGTLDLGGGALKFGTFPAKDAQTFTVMDGTYWLAPPDSRFTLNINAGAKVISTGRIYAGNAKGETFNVRDGSILDVTSTSISVLGSWYDTRWVTINLTNGSSLIMTNANVYAGFSGKGTVTCDQSTFDCGEKNLVCTRPSDNTKKSKYNGAATLTFKNHSTFRAKQVTYGNPAARVSTDPSKEKFSLQATAGSTLYVASFEEQSNVNNLNLTFDNATLVPMEMANAVLFKDFSERTVAAIHITAGGLTIANSNNVPIVLAARMDGAGALTIKANKNLVTVNQPINCGAVTIEDPGAVNLTCAEAFGVGMQVTLRYTETPAVGQVMTWGTRPDRAVFVLAGDAAGGYELEEVENGLVVKSTGSRPAVDAYWTGAGTDPSDMMELANWRLCDAAGEVMAQGYIDGTTTCHFPGGTLPFDLNAAFACRALYIEGDTVLDQDRNWTASTVPFFVVAGATVDLNGHALALSGLQNGADAHSSFVGTGGSIVFDVPAGQTNDVAGLSLAKPNVLIKRGAGTLRLVDLAGQPVLQSEAGTTLLAWTGDPAVNPFATTPIKNLYGTIDLGGATWTLSSSMAVYKNGAELKNGTYNFTGGQWSWDAVNDNYYVGEGAIVHTTGVWYHMNKQHPKFYIRNGGVFSYDSTGRCQIGCRYVNRNGSIYVQNGSTFALTRNGIDVGFSGNGYLYVQSGSTVAAEGQTIRLDGWYNVGSDVGYGYLEVSGASTVKAKSILFGQTGHDHGNVKANFSGDSTLFLDYLGSDGTATLPNGLNINFTGVTVVPTADTTPASPLLSDGQDYEVAKFHVNGAGLCVSNVNEKTLAFDAKFDGKGPFEVKAFRQDIALASTLACTNVVLTDMRTMTLAAGAQLSIEGGSVVLNYSNGRPVCCGKVISWTPETQPANVAFALDEKTSGPFLLHVKADGVYIESGLVLFIR